MACFRYYKTIHLTKQLAKTVCLPPPPPPRTSPRASNPTAPNPHHYRLQRTRWSAEEDKLLGRAVSEFGSSSWTRVAQVLQAEGCERDADQCLQRWNFSVNPAIRRGDWSPEEDELLRAAYTRLKEAAEHAPQLGVSRPVGAKSGRPVAFWVKVSRAVPGRTQAQCRERWTNKLDPYVRRDAFTPDEDKHLLKLAEEHRMEWSKVARALCTLGDTLASGQQATRRTDAQVALRYRQLTKPARPPGSRAGRLRRVGHGAAGPVETGRAGFSYVSSRGDGESATANLPAADAAAEDENVPTLEVAAAPRRLGRRGGRHGRGSGRCAFIGPLGTPRGGEASARPMTEVGAIGSAPEREPATRQPQQPPNLEGGCGVRAPTAHAAAALSAASAVLAGLQNCVASQAAESTAAISVPRMRQSDASDSNAGCMPAATATSDVVAHSLGSLTESPPRSKRAAAARAHKVWVPLARGGSTRARAVATAGVLAPTRGRAGADRRIRAQPAIACEAVDNVGHTLHSDAQQLLSYHQNGERSAVPLHDRDDGAAPGVLRTLMLVALDPSGNTPLLLPTSDDETNGAPSVSATMSSAKDRRSSGYSVLSYDSVIPEAPRAEAANGQIAMPAAADMAGNKSTAATMVVGCATSTPGSPARARPQQRQKSERIAGRMNGASAGSGSEVVPTPYPVATSNIPGGRPRSFSARSDDELGGAWHSYIVGIQEATPSSSKRPRSSATPRRSSTSVVSVMPRVPRAQVARSSSTAQAAAPTAELAAAQRRSRVGGSVPECSDALPRPLERQRSKRIAVRMSDGVTSSNVVLTPCASATTRCPSGCARPLSARSHEAPDNARNCTIVGILEAMPSSGKRPRSITAPQPRSSVVSLMPRAKAARGKAPAVASTEVRICSTAGDAAPEATVSQLHQPERQRSERIAMRTNG